MPRSKFALFIAIMLTGTSLACSTVTRMITSPNSSMEDSNDPATATPVEEPQPAVKNDVFCPNITQTIMDVASTLSESDTISNQDARNNDDVTYLVTYAIEDDKLVAPAFEKVPSRLKTEQQDSAAHVKIWDYFAGLIPATNRAPITEFSIMTDGEDNILASVLQTENDPSQWALEVDIADTRNLYDLTYTLIHEYGHVLTLGPDQVTPSLAVFNNPDDNAIYLKELSACPNYFPGEGCANADSYVNAFEKKFWDDIYDEWNQINLEEDNDVYYDKLDAFYRKYQDRFVNDYAVTNPEEDIAESWSFFVLGPKPEDNSMANAKVLFFYRYSELVQLRSQILNNLCASFPSQ